MQHLNRASTLNASGVFETNKVIKNTYSLLALTIIFSAFTAFLSTVMNVQIPPLLSFAGMIGLLFLTHALANSALGIICVFGFTGFAGLTLGPMLNYYIDSFSNGGELIAAALGSTGVIFFALSGYAMSSRKDFSFLGGFLFVGFTVAVLAGLASMFFNIPAMQLVISGAVVLLSSGYILFETSRLIHGGERNYIRATISLYLDIFNIFVNLLRIFGSFAGNRD